MCARECRFLLQVRRDRERPRCDRGERASVRVVRGRNVGLWWRAMGISARSGWSVGWGSVARVARRAGACEEAEDPLKR